MEDRGIIVPSIRVLVESGYSFGTAAEQKAAEIEATMERKGLVTNYEGEVIANLAAEKKLNWPKKNKPMFIQFRKFRRPLRTSMRDRVASESI